MVDTTVKSSPGDDITTIIKDMALLFIKFWYTTFVYMIRACWRKTETNVEGELVFITGTGHGMGKQMAIQYSALGAKVICVDINEKNNDQTVQEVKQAGGTAYGYTCDITNREAVLAMVAKINQEHGFISIVVNNAGIMPCHPMLEQTEKEIRLMYELNVFSHFWILQAVLPDMIKRNKGHIVAMSSLAGLFGMKNLVPYCGAKYGVRGVMQAMSKELRQINPRNKIKFTTIYPYMVDTGLCKNPRIRFPWMTLIKPKRAAASIILAQRTNIEEACIPRLYSLLEIVSRIIPTKALDVIDDYFESYIETDKM